MKRFIVFCLVALAFANTGFTQTPQYKCTKYPGTGTPSASWLFHAIQGKIQSIFYPTDFPGMPAGKISAIYLRVGRTYGLAAPAVYDTLRVKIGYTADSFFTPGATVYDTFKTGLTTILDAKTFTIQGSDTVGKWIKIPVDQQLGGFTYDPLKMFVVEVSYGPKPNNTGIDLMATNLSVSGTKQHSLTGNRDSLRERGGANAVYLDLGIDLFAKAGTSSTVANLQEALVYPNPAKGTVNISLTTLQTVKGVSIAITSVNGI